MLNETMLQGLPGCGGTDHVLASQMSYGLLKSWFEESTRAANNGDGHMSLVADSYPKKSIGSIGAFHHGNQPNARIWTILLEE